ncbi:MAG: ThiF family adenylyltransferase, partial [Desulfovibrio sp.]|nr:ThiF family adenylyltransferase [Desulfovibrio sp.]
MVRLLSSSVLVLGAGGLGGLTVQLLARLGVGRLAIVDGDCFE